MDQMGSDPHQDALLTNRLAHPLEIGVLKVAKSSVDEFQAIGGSSGAEVRFLEQANLKSAANRIPGDSRTVNASAHNDEIITSARSFV